MADGDPASDDERDALFERILSLQPSKRVPCCIALCGHHSRSARQVGLQALRSFGPASLSESSAQALLDQLRRDDCSWGARASALDALALHSPRLIAPSAHMVADLLDSAHWCHNAVGVQALELLDVEAVQAIAEAVLRALSSKDFVLQAVRAPGPCLAPRLDAPAPVLMADFWTDDGPQSSLNPPRVWPDVRPQGAVRVLTSLPPGALAHVASLVARLHPILAECLARQAAAAAASSCGAPPLPPPTPSTAASLMARPPSPSKGLGGELASITSVGSSGHSSHASSVNVAEDPTHARRRAAESPPPHRYAHNTAAAAPRRAAVAGLG